MDNSPRFDINEPFAAIDLTCYAVAETELVARFIEELMPEHREAVHLGWMAEELAGEVQEYFWHAEDGFFYDRYPDGDWVQARTLAGLIPLFAGVASAAQAAELVTRHLQDPRQFWTPFPLPRWPPTIRVMIKICGAAGPGPGMNLLLIHGLRRYGYHQVADELRQRTLDGLAETYLQTAASGSSMIRADRDRRPTCLVAGGLAPCPTTAGPPPPSLRSSTTPWLGCRGPRSA